MAEFEQKDKSSPLVRVNDTPKQTMILHFQFTHFTHSGPRVYTVSKRSGQKILVRTTIVFTIGLEELSTLKDVHRVCRVPGVPWIVASAARI